MKTKLTIGYLYPQLMSIYGDRGNILTLAKRAHDREIPVEVVEIEVGDKIPGEVNLIFFGGGQDKEQILASEDLLKNKKEQLIDLFEKGAPGLFICGGYQLMGNYYRPFDSAELPGVGILDVVTLASNERMIGNLLIKTNPGLVFSHSMPQLIGFENHSGKTFLGPKAKPLGEVIRGHGNNSEDKTEGANYKNIFGCYLHGPVLPKNPSFADYLIKKALEYSSKDEVVLKPLDDFLELQAHQAAIFSSRKNS